MYEREKSSYIRVICRWCLRTNECRCCDPSNTKSTNNRSLLKLIHRVYEYAVNSSVCLLQILKHKIPLSFHLKKKNCYLFYYASKNVTLDYITFISDDFYGFN